MAGVVHTASIVTLPRLCHLTAQSFVIFGFGELIELGADSKQAAYRVGAFYTPSALLVRRLTPGSRSVRMPKATLP